MSLFKKTKPKHSRREHDLYASGVKTYSTGQIQLLTDISVMLNLDGLTIDTLDKVVMKMGKYMRVSRALVGKKSADDKTFSIISEWVFGNTPSVKEKLQNVSYKQIPTFYEKLYGEGIWYFSDREELPEELKKFEMAGSVQSSLALPIYVNGFSWGAIAYDECEKPRTWSKEDINLLITVAHIIGLALGNKTSKI